MCFVNKITMHSPRASSPRSPRGGAATSAAQGGAGTGAKGSALKEEMKRRKKAIGAAGNIQLQDERLQMECEDMSARQERFRETVREEARQIKLREQAERAEKQRQAEVRRGAVLERLRKIQEEEERMAREAAEREAAVVEAAERAALREKNRCIDDQFRMPGEDERSALVEAIYREEQERARYNAEQAYKQEQWEASQREADAAEEANRAERAALLEEKKRKLAILRAKFPEVKVGGAVGGSDTRLQRIRNKAVYRSKAAKGGGGAGDEPVADDAGTGVQSAGQLQSMPQEQEPDDAHAAFLARVAAMDSENELRVLQGELSVSKRALRLEQRQTKGKDELALVRKNIAALVKQEAVLAARLEELPSGPASSSAGGLCAVEPAGQAPAPVESQPATPRAADAMAPLASRTPAKPLIKAESFSAATGARSMMAFYKRAEVLLRGASSLTAQLGDGTASVQARDVMVMELVDAIKSVSESDDNLAPGYCKRLTDAATELKEVQVAAQKSDEEVRKKKEEQALKELQEKDAKEKEACERKEKKERKERERKEREEKEQRDRQQREAALQLQREEQTAHSETTAKSVTSPAPSPAPVPTPASAPEPYVDKEEEEEWDGDEDENEDEDELDPETLEGWHECIDTSMATAAHHAAYYGYYPVLEVIAQYFDVSAADESGKTPLHYAALANQLDCVYLLVQCNAGLVDIGDELGDTALHAAASSSEGGSVLEFLLSCECSPDIANYEGKTLAHVARTVQNLQIIAAAGGMLYCVDSLSRTPLYCAAYEGNVPCIKYLMQQTPSEYQMWPDEKNGDSPLHVAASRMHEAAVDMLCSDVANIEDISIVNKKHYTAAHLAASAGVLTKLYENGADLWIADSKQRYPLYIQCFFGRADNVAFLLNAVQLRGNALELISTRDMNGDSALHVASLCGQTGCAALLLYFLPNEPNAKGLTPDALAERAGHLRIQQMILHVQQQRDQGVGSETIFGCSFEHIAQAIVHHGSRWTKCYSAEHNCCYYLDRPTGSSCWEQPELYDADPKDERKTDTARDALISFYSQYNPTRLHDVDKIVEAYRGKYTELFIDLATRYNVQDLSIFENVYVED